MLCIKNLAKYFLAATIFSCLSVIVLATGESFHNADSATDDETSHRGSGRIMSLHPENHSPFNAIAYRGTGRIYPDQEEIVVSHRGSGRIDDQTPDANETVYRGSGRISPNSSTLPLEFA